VLLYRIHLRLNPEGDAVIVVCGNDCGIVSVLPGFLGHLIRNAAVDGEGVGEKRCLGSSLPLRIEEFVIVKDSALFRARSLVFYPVRAGVYQVQAY